MIRLFHPSVAPHVQQAALALHDAGMLDRLVTGVVDLPASRVQQALVLAARLAGIDGEKEFRRRSITLIPPDKIEPHPWGELLRVAVSRMDRDKRLSDLVWEQTERAFDRGVARGLHRGLCGVYGYQYSSRHTFTRARELGLRIAYEMPSPEPLFVHELLQKERASFPELETPYSRHVARREAMWIAHRKTEWDCADIVLAASNFTRNSYAAAGWDVDKVRVIPFGSPPAIENDRASQGGSGGRGPLRLVWAGNFSVLKGAHYVLEAWQNGGWSTDVVLDVYGSMLLPPRLIQNLPPGIHFHGSIPRPVLMDKFSEGDALLFPTLCDGFGMVATEAWSRGLPVITTPCAGAAERLVEGETGFCIPPADPAAIIKVVQHCLDNRPKLQSMRPLACDSARSRTWADYRRDLVSQLKQAGFS